MTTDRLMAFTDAVLAIAITITAELAAAQTSQEDARRSIAVYRFETTVLIPDERWNIRRLGRRLWSARLARH